MIYFREQRIKKNKYAQRKTPHQVMMDTLDVYTSGEPINHIQFCKCFNLNLFIFTLHDHLCIFLLKTVITSGTELFVVRAFPRRLFNIQAVDGVSTIVKGSVRLQCLVCPLYMDSFLIPSFKIKIQLVPSQSSSQSVQSASQAGNCAKTAFLVDKKN